MVVVPQGDEPHRVLDSEGALVPGSKVPEISEEELARVLDTMLLVRTMDARMAGLQRQGRLGFYVPSTGEEAGHLAVHPLGERDWVFPGYRDHGAWFWRGHRVSDHVHQLLGSAGDPIKGRQMPAHHAAARIRMASVSGPAGAHLPQAVGAAHAAKIQRSGDVVMAFFGAAASSTGGFHVAMNFAGVYQVPVVLVCRNRGAAASASGERRAAAGRLADRARGYGVPAARVDGCDVLAVIQAATDAVQRARAGQGPTLIEAVTGPAPGQPDAARDPLQRFRAYLQHRGLWSAEREQAMIDAHEQAIDAALDQAASLGAPAPDTLFDDVYEAPTWLQREQRASLHARSGPPHAP